MTKKGLIQQYVAKKIYLLSHAESSSSKAMLANLRHGVGKAPGEDPILWGLFLEDAPEEMYSIDNYSGEPSKEEWAVYLALTLFAVHSQGSSSAVQSDGISIGKAAAKLMKTNTDDERSRIIRRFTPIVTADDMAGLSYHLRNFIQLLKSAGITLDYIKLAGDIYDFQFENSRKNVQLRWGRDFYETNNRVNEDKGE